MLKAFFHASMFKNVRFRYLLLHQPEFVFSGSGPSARIKSYLLLDSFEQIYSFIACNSITFSLSTCERVSLSAHAQPFSLSIAIYFECTLSQTSHSISSRSCIYYYSSFAADELPDSPDRLYPSNLDSEFHLT